MRLLALATPASESDGLPAQAAGGARAQEPEGARAAAREQARDEERQLVDRARRGDMPAFEALYRRNVQRVYALCWRLADDDPGADELLQETFVRAWENLGRFRGECSFATWLHPMVVRLALDQRRARRRGAWLLSSDQLALLEQPGAAGRPEAGFDLERALRRLPPRARAVFVLHDIEGHRHEEIAAMIGVDPGTSKSQLHRARKLLREALQ